MRSEKLNQIFKYLKMEEVCYICYEEGELFRPCVETKQCNLWVHQECIDTYANSDQFNQKCPGCQTPVNVQETVNKQLNYSSLFNIVLYIRQTIKINWLVQKYIWSNSKIKAQRLTWLLISWAILLYNLNSCLLYTSPSPRDRG